MGEFLINKNTCIYFLDDMNLAAAQQDVRYTGIPISSKNKNRSFCWSRTDHGRTLYEGYMKFWKGWFAKQVILAPLDGKLVF